MSGAIASENFSCIRLAFLGVTNLLNLLFLEQDEIEHIENLRLLQQSFTILRLGQRIDQNGTGEKIGPHHHEFNSIAK
jgi:hypothetical protein